MSAEPARDPDLKAAATEAFRNAYAPYSRFSVGAALLADDGRVFAGANVENASYGLGRCAEQSAIQAMATAGARRFTRLYVVTDASPPSTPCGACRQVLFEFGPDAVVTCANLAGEERTFTVRDLLPGAFGPQDLTER
ncbi:MAG TPA: cytidine deaminase [Deinococcales bacterium]|nr:cytidine deaminase [Deinococcales bacterium]